ncbi:hypothetical protein [Desulfovibrio sp. MES5]|uniref:hypothetical protein n=1 Tax=Desulfovibrio sp. MES5 TaxID=1899016 RepID=UPI0025B9D1E7|nr:hypothetical protein [Desulfovibrio sp. MES5]
MPEKLRGTGFHIGALLWFKNPIAAAVDKSGKVQQITMVQRSGANSLTPCGQGHYAH